MHLQILLDVQPLKPNSLMVSNYSPNIKETNWIELSKDRYVIHPLLKFLTSADKVIIKFCLFSNYISAMRELNVKSGSRQRGIFKLHAGKIANPNK